MVENYHNQLFLGCLNVEYNKQRQGVTCVKRYSWNKSNRYIKFRALHRFLHRRLNFERKNNINDMFLFDFLFTERLHIVSSVQ